VSDLNKQLSRSVSAAEAADNRHNSVVVKLKREMDAVSLDRGAADARYASMRGEFEAGAYTRLLFGSS